jgi:hypothetical protein
VLGRERVVLGQARAVLGRVVSELVPVVLGREQVVPVREPEVLDGPVVRGRAPSELAAAEESHPSP